MKNATRPVLVTGFEAYGGMTGNPALLAMQALDGTSIAGHAVLGRALPVAISQIRQAIAHLMEKLAPAAVISLGLAPGESVIRLERVGLNLANFTLPDNEGRTLTDHHVSPDGPPARWASLPLRRIEQALLANGIPARLSETAGTYLCNACLYALLEEAERLPRKIPCGFIHLPMTPDLAAAAIASRRHDGMGWLHPASMSPDLIFNAVRIAIAETMAQFAGA